MWTATIRSEITDDLAVRSELLQTAKTRSPFTMNVAVCCKNKRNGYYARNYQLMDEEFTRGMVIPRGIISSWTKNPNHPVDSLSMSW
jgi:hypothetical protein